MDFNKTQKRRQLTIESLNRQKQVFLEIKKKIIKSLKKNKNQTPAQLYYTYNFLTIKTTKFIQNKHQNRCLFTGRIKSFNKIFLVSRHTIKKFATYGYLQNLKKKTW